MKLPPKAYRFLERALRDIDPDVASEWIRRHPIGSDLPTEQIGLVRSVLLAAAYVMFQRLEQVKLSDDDKADLANDAEFILAVVRSLPETEQPLSAVA